MDRGKYFKLLDDSYTQEEKEAIVDNLIALADCLIDSYLDRSSSKLYKLFFESKENDKDKHK
ncbi:MAG TPA: hypothetical protein DCS13_07570 [Candidatus Margulisbacteria bacterium]|nr:hypothetical protein [Candidatus Margulisiibacteriota bacterium]